MQVVCIVAVVQHCRRCLTVSSLRAYYLVVWQFLRERQSFETLRRAQY